MTRSECIEQLEAAIGDEALLALSREYGGTPVYIPMTMPTDHSLPLVLGWRAAKALSEAFGGDRIDVPAMVTQTTHQQIRRRRREGATVVELAREFGYSTRQVRRITNG
jgi:hypothetical protein